MKTDRERLQLALDFAYEPDLLGKNRQKLREEIDTFLGSNRADIDELDFENLWPDCPGDAGVAVSVTRPIQMESFDGAGLIAFQREVRDLLEQALVEAVEIKMVVDGEDYTLALPAGHGGYTSADVGPTSWRFMGEGVNRILEAHAEPEDAYKLIVGFLVKGEATLRKCLADDCGKPFVRQGRRQYCSKRCSNRIRHRKHRESNPDFYRKRAEARRKKKSSNQGDN